MSVSNQQTYNKLIDLFYSVAMSPDMKHKMINSFGSGPTYNANVKNNLFPMLWVEPGTVTAVKNSSQSNSVGAWLYNFKFFVLDKIHKGDDNFNELMSDCNFILSGLITHFDKHIYWNELQISIDGNVIQEPMFEITDDNLNGWMADITFKIPNKLSICNTPFVPLLSFTVSTTTGQTAYRLIGPQGPQGAQGSVGAQGNQGATGSQGPQGSQGNQGATGPQGSIGNQGSQGPQGQVGATGSGGALGYYGSFFDTTTQTNPTASTANIMLINSTAEANGINNDASTQINFLYPGTYNIQFSAQFQKTSNGHSDYDIWLRKNGNNVVWSNSQVTLDKSGSNNPYHVASWNFMLSLNANDYIQLMWQSADTTVNIAAVGTQSNPTRPAIPSVIFTAQQVMYTQVGPTGSQGPQGQAGASYNFSTGLTVSGNTVSVNTSIIATTATLSNYATTATLSNYWSEFGSSLNTNGVFGSLNNFNTTFINNGATFATVFTQSSNATNGPSSNVMAFMGNTATASGVLNPLGVSNVWIQGISSQASNTALLTTFNSGAGGGTNRPHIRLINSSGQGTFMGMIDNSQSIVFGRNSDLFLTLGSGASILNSSASSAAQNSITVQAAHANTAGTSVALLVNNTGSNSSTGNVTTFRINNTETLSGSGEMLLMDAQRSSNTVFKINMSGAISAGTVSNATQSAWRLGKVITATSTLDTTKYVEISIDGTTYKLCIST